MTAIQRIEYNGVEMTVADVPDPGVRALLGYGHFPQDIQRRQRVVVPGRAWPHTPDTCLTDEYPGEWISPDVMVCSGCGWDST